MLFLWQECVVCKCRFEQCDSHSDLFLYFHDNVGHHQSCEVTQSLRSGNETSVTVLSFLWLIRPIDVVPLLLLFHCCCCSLLHCCCSIAAAVFFFFFFLCVCVLDHELVLSLHVCLKGKISAKDAKYIAVNRLNTHP